MVVIKVLGSGCANCQKVEETARKAAASLGTETQLLKVTELDQIMAYPILSTPGLVINERLVCSGRIPAEAEVMTWLADALEGGSSPS